MRDEEEEREVKILVNTKKKHIKGHEWNVLSVYLDFAVISSAELSFG